MKSIEGFLADTPVEASRLRFFPSRGGREGGDYVLFWMQKSQRSLDNPALDLAMHLANHLSLPLLCVFVLCDYPGAQAPHYRFMLEGLKRCAEDLRSRGAGFELLKGEPADQVLAMSRQATVLVADEGKLAFERRWREEIAASPDRPDMVIVETESVVPPSAVSDHLEWSAATIRRKISSQLPFYLSRESSNAECCGKVFTGRIGDDSLFDELPAGTPLGYGVPATKAARSRRRPGALLSLQRVGLCPGQHAALGRFDEFLGSGGLSRYEQWRNDPNAKASSGMSAYLHFGQVSPVRLTKKALEQSPSEAQAYVEQLVVRRELALNYVLYNPSYLDYESAAPDWARRSLASRRLPTRAYSDAELEEARTEDPYWNAAQQELVLSGTIHNYMRMYWGKQLLRWFSNPAVAFGIAVRINDSYSLDGRDPNGYAGIAWCFGRHDRPWPERQGFGSVRSMMASGLRKKFDADRYAHEMDCLYTSRMKETL